VVSALFATPGARHPPRPAGLTLGYAALTVGQIEQGIKGLAQCHRGQCAVSQTHPDFRSACGRVIVLDACKQACPAMHDTERATAWVLACR
jgi:hypothetical protein